LVFEDDALLCDDFVNKAVDFMYHVPRDWCMLYFGGRHLRKPQSITDRVDRALKVERTHAYALRGDFLRTVYQAMNDTPLVKEADEVFWNLTEEAAFENEPLPVYCPTRWLVAQDEGDSDITPIHKGVRWGDDD
jgi:hypothetical protein